jgi:hypothetical protein
LQENEKAAGLWSQLSTPAKFEPTKEEKKVDTLTDLFSSFGASVTSDAVTETPPK